jgi:uracil-DNA glycosylase
MSEAAARLWAQIPDPWKPLIEAEVRSADWLAPLATFVESERAEAERGGPAIFPPAPQTFAALALTPPSAVKVVILGQDPYFRAGQAHGLAFSVADGVRVPPSLANVFKELEADLGLPRSKSGNLTRWAERGVLLLNTLLSVRAGVPASHARKGWEKLTGELLRGLSIAHAEPGRVFVLWGSAAQSRRKLIEAPREGLVTRHAVLEASHPSPRSVDKPAPIAFLGSKPFSKANAALRERGLDAIDWSL